MSHKQIYYSDKYDDEKYEYRCVWLVFIRLQTYFASVSTLSSNGFREVTMSALRHVILFRSIGVMLLSTLSFYRHVMLPKDIAKRVPKTHLMSETEWRNLGVQQSQGWVHYMIHQPGISSFPGITLQLIGISKTFHCDQVWKWVSGTMLTFSKSI